MTAFHVTFKRAHDVSIYQAQDRNGVVQFWPICTCKWNDDRKAKSQTFNDQTTAFMYAREAHLRKLTEDERDAGVMMLRREMYG